MIEALYNAYGFYIHINISHTLSRNDLVFGERISYVSHMCIYIITIQLFAETLNPLANI